MSENKPVANEIFQWEITRLKPYEKNARTHSPEQVAQLAASMKEFGFTNPVLVTPEGELIAGHGRVEAAKEAGFETVPVIVLSHLSEEQKRAYILADNKLALNAGWDFNLLATELQALELGGYNTELTGFSRFEIDSMLTTLELDPAPPPDNVPGARKIPVVSPGELFHLGKHRLVCGDARIVTHYDKLMGGAKADMVWTDPPYNVAYEGKTSESLTIQNDSMSDEEFYKFLYDAYTNMIMHTSPGSAIYVAHADSEGVNFRKAMKDAGWLLKQCLIWVKQTLVMGRQDYHWKHEPILYGWKPGGAHNWYTDRKQTTVLEFDKPSRNGEHPTMKPLELIQYCITNSCRPRGVVLDPFGGSGSTLIAAEKTGRLGFLLEIDPIYCGVILDRYEASTGKQAVRDDGIAWEDIKRSKGLAETQEDHEEEAQNLTV